MFFRRVREVEFIGGPLDGHRQPMTAKAQVEAFAIPVNENVHRMLVGAKHANALPTSSIAIYELRKRDGQYRYDFVEAKSPKEFGV